MIHSLIQNRFLILELVRRDLKTRYLGSALGFFWTVLNPVLSLIIYTIIFSVVLKVRIGENGGTFAFVLYLFCGLLPWITFQESVSRSVTAIPENANLVQKMRFPVEILPVVLSFSGFVQQMVGTGIFLLVLLGGGNRLTWWLLLLPVILFLQLLIMVGLGWIVSSLYVYFRDTSQIMGILLNVWFWITPIVYAVRSDQIPALFQIVIEWNPLSHLIRMYRFSLLSGEPASLFSWIYLTLFAVGCFLIGSAMIRKLKPDFADLI